MMPLSEDHQNFCYNYREAISYMSYFREFNRMFVFSHFYITHEAVCDSLHDLNFIINALRHVVMYAMATMHCHLFYYIKT